MSRFHVISADGRAAMFKMDTKREIYKYVAEHLDDDTPTMRTLRRILEVPLTLRRRCDITDDVVKVMFAECHDTPDLSSQGVSTFDFFVVDEVVKSNQ